MESSQLLTIAFNNSNSFSLLVLSIQDQLKCIIYV